MLSVLLRLRSSTRNWNKDYDSQLISMAQQKFTGCVEILFERYTSRGLYLQQLLTAS